MRLHFLGLAGMRRRIRDYRDALEDFNVYASFGSLISVVSAFLFMSMLFMEFYNLGVTALLTRKRNALRL